MLIPILLLTTMSAVPSTAHPSRPTREDVRARVAENFDNWLDDFLVLRSLVRRVVRQRLGRDSSAIRFVLGETLAALRRIGADFERNDNEAASEEDEDGRAGARERMLMETAKAVQGWLGWVASLPALKDVLTEAERGAVGKSPAELVELEFESGGEIPVVPWEDRAERRPRAEAVVAPQADSEDEDEGESEVPQAPRHTGRSTAARGKIAAGPEAAVKVRIALLEADRDSSCAFLVCPMRPQGHLLPHTGRVSEHVSVLRMQQW
jgi:hypothetical protein